MFEKGEKPKSSILIVDDNPANIQFLAKLLTNEGYNVAACTHSESALPKILKILPNLILLDIMMPGISGIEICKAIKAKNSTKNIPVIFITAKSDSEDVVKGFKVGAVDYITKPYNAAELLVRVKTQMELQQSRKSILAMNKELQAQSNAKSDFLARMSHEIRTPLNAIIGMSTILSQQKLTTSQHKYMQVLNSSCDFLLYIVNDILDLSKIESGQYQLESNSFDLWDTIEKVCENTSFLAHKKQIELICNIDFNINQYVVGDSVRLQQVLFNLVSNAIKFTQKGEIEVKVICKDDHQPDKLSLHFSIRDTGLGIPKKQLQDIFEKYKQVKTEKTRAYGGTGLGLPICKTIIELMGGQISVQSQEKKGTVFSFFVLLSKSQQAEKTINKYFLKNKRILIIDNNETYCQCLSSHLKYFGANVKFSTNTGSSLQLIEQAYHVGQPYTAIFIDAHITDSTRSFSDGFSLADHIVDTYNEKKMVLMFNTQNIETNISRTEKMALLGYLLKPYKRNELNLIIDRLLHDKPDLKETVPPSLKPLKIENKRILLVEDHPNNQLVFTCYLDDIQSEIDIADNGEIAVNKVKENSYDLIFMDIEMPVMNGYEATKCIREWEKRQDLPMTPIIALTAHIFKDGMKSLIDKGFTDYLQKPLKQNKLIDIITRI